MFNRQGLAPLSIAQAEHLMSLAWGRIVRRMLQQL